MEKDTPKLTVSGSDQRTDDEQEEVVSPHTHSRRMPLAVETGTGRKVDEEDTTHGFLDLNRDTPVVREHLLRRELVWRTRQSN
jgi:hypothetical protein